MFPQSTHLKSFIKGTPSAYISGQNRMGHRCKGSKQNRCVCVYVCVCVCVYVCVCLIYVEQNKGSITKEEGETRYWVGN